MKKAFLLAATLSLGFTVQAQDAAKPKPATYLTEEQARAIGPDFDLQGEYAGGKIGAQVIALGDDTFRAVFLKGGLPGAGWDKSPKVEIEAKRSGESVQFEKDGWKVVLKKGALSGDGAWGAFELKRESRQSPTLGAKPP